MPSVVIFCCRHNIDLCSSNSYTYPMFSGLRKVILVLLPLLFLARLLTAAPSIRAISIAGNKAFSEREILGWLSSAPGLALSHKVLESDRRKVLQYYLQSGYYDAIIEPGGVEYNADSSSVNVTLRLNEGQQTVVGTLSITGSVQFAAAELLEIFDTKEGSPLSQPVLERDIDETLALYERIGYPFAECTVEHTEIRSGEERKLLDITLHLTENGKVTIDEIRLEGNKETDPGVVVRETRFASGETFNPAKVEAIRPRLMRLNIFTDVAEPELYIRNQKGGLLIKVREGNTNTFDGVIGYVPSGASGASGYVTGLASVSMRNLFGTGRKFSFRWQREDRLSQELGMRYLEPWIAGYPVNIGGGFFQRKQDTSYVRRAFDLKTELMLSDDLVASVLFNAENVIPSDTTFRSVFKSTTISFGAEIQYDTRDDFFSPTSGVRYRTDYSYGTKRFRNIPTSLAQRVKSKATVQKITLDLDFFLPAFSRQVIALGLHGRELQSGQPEEGEMFRFGGARSLRGYRENQFLGSRVAWSNAEYRFLLARRSFIYGFADTGYYLRPVDEVRAIPRSDAFTYGYGVGIQLETGLGIMGVSFALGEGDTFTNGKVHFGIINEF